MALANRIEQDLRALLDAVEKKKPGVEQRRLAASIREHLVAKQERDAERKLKLQERQGYTLRMRLRVLDARGIPSETVPPAGPVWETDYFRCAHFSSCLVDVKTCMLRQGAKWPGGNRLKDGSVREKKAKVHPYCGSGKCDQGHDLAMRCAFRPESVWTKGRYKFYRPDSHLQREAAKKLRAEAPPEEGERAELTPFQEVAAMTKDDPVMPGGV